ncbi:MAG: DUF1028 domain-containing protein [Candidatus Binatia bacterium]
MTYSIVARDPDTGALGVGVQSHFFAVGRMIQWAEAGVGAVATQSFIEPSYGKLGLDLMRAGRTAPEALRGLLAADAKAEIRQVGMVDAAGNAHAHTGSGCVAEAGQIVAPNLAIQANMMARSTAIHAMRKAYEASRAPFPVRLLEALDAAEADGGDIRGKQSAALLVVAGERSGHPWDNVLVDIRVDDHEAPLVELRRLLDHTFAFGHMLDLFNTEGLMSHEFTASPERLDWALETLGKAQAILGKGNLEPTLWRGVLLARAGRLADARRDIADAVQAHPDFGVFLRRLPAAGFLRSDPKLLAQLLGES